MFLLNNATNKIIPQTLINILNIHAFHQQDYI